MKFDENLAAVHAYLCADGYVIKNPPTQKQRYYVLGFRNTNLVLLKDFQERFEKAFGTKPHLEIGQRCRIGSKKIYEQLTKKFGSFYSWEWRMPNMNKKLSRLWLRAYFDCEGWVFCKSHQNRHIGIDCVNELGLDQVEKIVNQLKIKTIRRYNKKRKIHRLFIYGKENLKRFYKEIGFLHPDKSKKLLECLKDYIEYSWQFPKDELSSKKFVLDLLKDKARIKEPYYIRLYSKEKLNLNKLSKYLKKLFQVDSLVRRCVNGLGTVYYEMDINRKKEVRKLINLEVIPNLFK